MTDHHLVHGPIHACTHKAGHSLDISCKQAPDEQPWRSLSTAAPVALQKQCLANVTEKRGVQKIHSWLKHAEKEGGREE